MSILNQTYFILEETNKAKPRFIIKNKAGHEIGHIDQGSDAITSGMKIFDNSNKIWISKSSSFVISKL